MVTQEWKLVKQGGRDRRVRQGGNKDEWKGVGDGTEICRMEVSWRRGLEV